MLSKLTIVTVVCIVYLQGTCRCETFQQNEILHHNTSHTAIWQHFGIELKCCIVLHHTSYGGIKCLKTFLLKPVCRLHLLCAPTHAPVTGHIYSISIVPGGLLVTMVC